MNDDPLRCMIWKFPGHNYPWRVDSDEGNWSGIFGSYYQVFQTWREAMEYATGGPLT